ncbi:hypothetical protein IM793_23565 [Pedobacter sp. MR2016-19]|uniref:hypothetical protein n=1 Tax=Pedobacter sp. MR2016-19 TaxID=2780089 RepID=UPI0018739479|nr:hypothetical protein [Pedobacter sp. MR2016-19]MBE5322151.1 hypothetical protein [Pedobacter sp. MR2016-19]
MLIEIHTSENERAASLLNFFKIAVSPANGRIFIEYENVDQVPSIYRILEEADIDVFNIELKQ